MDWRQKFVIVYYTVYSSVVGTYINNTSKSGFLLYMHKKKISVCKYELFFNNTMPLHPDVAITTAMKVTIQQCRGKLYTYFRKRKNQESAHRLPIEQFRASRLYHSAQDFYDNCHDLVVVSTLTSPVRYCTFTPRDLIEFTKRLQPSERIFCSLFYGSQPCHLYFDVDAKHIPEMAFLDQFGGLDQFRVKFKTLVDTAMYNCFGRNAKGDVLNESEWQWENASSSKKSSFHIHVLCETFTSTAHMKNWAISYLKPLLIPASGKQDTLVSIDADIVNGLTFVDNKGKHASYIDFCVYTPNRMFRLCGHTKTGSGQQVLRPFTAAPVQPDSQGVGLTRQERHLLNGFATYIHQTPTDHKAELLKCSPPPTTNKLANLTSTNPTTKNTPHLKVKTQLAQNTKSFVSRARQLKDWVPQSLIVTSNQETISEPSKPQWNFADDANCFPAVSALPSNTSERILDSQVTCVPLKRIHFRSDAAPPAADKPRRFYETQLFSLLTKECDKAKYDLQDTNLHSLNGLPSPGTYVLSSHDQYMRLVVLCYQLYCCSLRYIRVQFIAAFSQASGTYKPLMLDVDGYTKEAGYMDVLAKVTADGQSVLDVIQLALTQTLAVTDHDKIGCVLTTACGPVDTHPSGTFKSSYTIIFHDLLLHVKYHERLRQVIVFFLDHFCPCQKLLTQPWNVVVDAHVMQPRSGNRVLYCDKPNQNRYALPYARVDALGCICNSPQAWYTFVSDCSIGEYSYESIPSSRVLPVFQAVPDQLKPLMFTDLEIKQTSQSRGTCKRLTDNEKETVQQFIDDLFQQPRGVCQISPNLNVIEFEKGSFLLEIHCLGQTVPCPFQQGSGLCAGRKAHMHNRTCVKIFSRAAKVFCYDCKSEYGGQASIPGDIFRKALQHRNWSTFPLHYS